jgi:hypothetical protein
MLEDLRLAAMFHRKQNDNFELRFDITVDISNWTAINSNDEILRRSTHRNLSET